MCVPVLVGVAMAATAAAGGYSAYNQYQTGAAQNKYYNTMANNANTEARYALEEGEAALKVGDLQSKLIQDQASAEGKNLKTGQAEFNAKQRASFAAMGLSGVSVEDITKNTLSKEKLDELTLRYNADIHSWETETDAKYKNQAKKYQAWQSNIQADQLRYQGKAAFHVGKTGAATTLLSTAASVAMMGAMAGGGAGAGSQGAGSVKPNSFNFQNARAY